MSDEEQTRLAQEDRERVRALFRQFRDDLPQITVELHVDQPAEPLIKQAIARYEQLHKLDRKVTLKQICEEMNVNYGSARVLKSRYAKQKRKRKKS